MENIENKVGVAVITTEEYKKLIKNECYIEELEEEICKKDNQISQLIEKIAVQIEIKNNYEIGKLEMKDGNFVKDNYGYNELKKEFYAYGIKDENCINKKIKEFYDNRIEE